MPINSNIQPSAGTRPLGVLNAELQRISTDAHNKKMETFGRATGSDPYGIDAQLKQLGDQYEGMFSRVAATGKDPTSIQVEYDRAKAGLMQTKNQLGLIQQLGASGAITPDAAQRASAVAMGVPATAFSQPGSVMPSARGVSPAGVKSHFEMFTGSGVKKSLTTDPEGWWDKKNRKYVDPEKMKGMYFQWRLNENLDDPRNANQLPGFNDSFARAMRADPDTKKVFDELVGKGENSSLDMRVAFAKPSQLTGIAARKAGVSPLGNAMRPPAASKIRVVSPDGVTGTIDAGEWDQYQAQGFRRTQ